MAKFIIKQNIKKPLSIVYQAFANLDNMVIWTKDLEKVEVIKGKFGEIGATAKLYFNQNGKRSVLEDQLLSLDPMRRIESQVTGGGLIANVTTIFEPSGNETLMILKWCGKGRNIAISFIINLMKHKIRKNAIAEIRIFKDLVEKYGIHFPKHSVDIKH